MSKVSSKLNYLKAYQAKLNLTADGIIGPKSAKAMMADLGITNKLFFVHMMGQVAHESGGYVHARENLNYSVAGLLNIFKKYYTPKLAEEHAYNPELIANHVYANRMGNGDAASGDGFKYRGAFGLQLTGKNNFQAFYKYLNLPMNTEPSVLLDDPRNYFLAGKFWFEVNDAVKLCVPVTEASILRVSRKVNLGRTNTSVIPHGLGNRILQTNLMLKAVGGIIELV
jgi:putative chitinase